MAKLTPGELIRHEELGQLLGLDFLDPKDKQAILQAARTAVERLRADKKMVFALVRGHGYQVAEPTLVIELARRHQAKAVAEIDAGQAKVDAIDLTGLDTTTARLVKATAAAFARQAVMMQQLDVRQNRLETTMAIVGSTAQAAFTRAAHASSRVDDAQAEIDELKRRLQNLEAARDAPR
jgi:hypothetical protein